MTDKSIAFVINQSKSEFYYAWGEGLEKAGVTVFYISPSPRWSKWLRLKGVPDYNILALHKLSKEWCNVRPLSAEELTALSNAEKVGPLSISSMVQMDRTLSTWEPNKAMLYAGVTALAVEGFIKSNSIVTVLGETTWLVELLTAQVAADMGAQFFAPSTARVPSERIVFFEGPLQRSYFRVNKLNSKNLEAAKAELQKLEERKPQPYYMNVTNRLGFMAKYFLTEAIRHIAYRKETGGDLTVLPFYKRISNQLIHKWNRILVRRYIKFEDYDDKNTQPYVYLTLHKQPEASIDVLAAPYTNQLENIRALARLLPIGYELWVKEHRSALGDRSLKWYANLKSIPNLKLISAEADGFDIMKSAEVTISPSGTASYEAGLLGYRSLCFAEMYFGPIQTRNSFCPFSTTPNEFKKILAAKKLSKEKIVEYLGNILANSYNARIGDPISDSACMLPENIEALVDATLKIHSIR